jgi:hypothetical protein
LPLGTAKSTRYVFPRALVGAGIAFVLLAPLSARASDARAPGGSANTVIVRDGGNSGTVIAASPTVSAHLRLDRQPAPFERYYGKDGRVDMNACAELEVNIEDNSETTLAEDAVVTLKPGHGFAKKIRFQRG